MIELRWKQKGLMSVARHGTAVIGEETGKPNLVLEYRYLKPQVYAGGAFCSPGEWSEWEEVSTVYEEEHRHENE